jgi:hypothetical protein
LVINEACRRTAAWSPVGALGLVQSVTASSLKDALKGCLCRDESGSLVDPDK